MKSTRRLIPVLILTFGVILVYGCANKPAQKAGVVHPKWSKNANIYEVNIRQYTEEGTFKAFQEHLPRLQEMGVKILWIMPIYPIGEKNRKGTLGSYYSIKDYKAVNSNFGTMEGFKALVDEAHERGMKVILDWVANHTAWDHHWTKEHPGWYTKDENGNFKPPVADWSDVIELDYSNQAMRDAMIEAMKFWVTEAGVDGYRCDVAAAVPTEFWVRATKELNKIKPVFMLAEANQPELHDQAFDMSYAWDFHFLINEIATGKKPLTALDKQMKAEQKKFEANDYRMMFTSNHDENSWKGTVYERMGENVKVGAVLAATIQGMPLIYSGQEAGLEKRLDFFEKDVINWDELPLEDFYTTLLHLKTENEALWNGKYGGDFVKVETNKPENVYAYKRVKGDDEVFVILNFGDEQQEISFLKVEEISTYTNVFTGQEMTIGGQVISLAAHDYLVLEK
ncbi:MAG TPA: alpha-amylase family glycosyl hydrolase [Balneolaceae bacterium]|nr:alpha-amylase family glycosyl hydrolase [Balneolaceae bacterium]